MITVRFPTGFSVQYNSGSYVETGEGFQRIKTAMLGTTIARAPLDCIVEWVPPCRTYFAEDGERIASLEREIKSLKRRLAKATK